MNRAKLDVYSGVTPYLIISGAAEAISFYKQVFDATEIVRVNRSNGEVAHAELRIGEARIMLADELPESMVHSPKSLGGSAVTLLLYVEDVDRTLQQAGAAGAQIVRPARNLSYGDRTATITDPFGHRWTVATHKQDVPLEEMLLRASGGKAQG